MFGGNAKTHFQVLGRANNSVGYMMSPFGDDRWDLDDSEKLRKIYKKPDLVSPSTMNFQANLQQHPCHGVKTSPSDLNASTPYRTGIKPYSYDYVNQSGASPGYIPKAEMKRVYQSQQTAQVKPSIQVHDQRLGYYQDDQNLYKQYQGSGVSHMQDVYGPNPVRHHNGLNQDEIKQRSRMVCALPNYPTTHNLNQSSSQMSNVCGQCQHVQNVQTVQPIQQVQPMQYAQNAEVQRHWKSSPDVPLWIAGSSSYRPFGPAEPTPNPYYPPREKNEYIPLN